jgi:ABC-type nitrate/sulfonate/bicarbonate transport system ATPase subunit
MSAVSLRGLRFAFDGQALLFDGFDLEIPAGQVLAVVGPSGSGKSTLLRLLAGLLRPQAGAVEVGGRRASMVFQAPTLLAWRSAQENVELPLQIAGIDPPERCRRAREALAQVGLAEAAGLLPRELSGGMAMRVSLARALVTRPDLLLLDEPFSALDALTRRRVRAVFEAAWVGATVVMVTHDIDEAVLLADRALVLGGRPLRPLLDLPLALLRPRDPHSPEVGERVRRLEAVVGL